ncbi:MAG: hypothetical protein ACJ8C4_15655 [Gemmataceae bacterium]
MGPITADAVSYTGKTVAVKLHHTGSGSSAGNVNWGDGSSTVTLAGWSFSTTDQVLTHVYSSSGKITVSAADTNLSNSDSATPAAPASPAGRCASRPESAAVGQGAMTRGHFI